MGHIWLENQIPWCYLTLPNKAKRSEEACKRDGKCQRRQYFPSPPSSAQLDGAGCNRFLLCGISLLNFITSNRVLRLSISKSLGWIWLRWDFLARFYEALKVWAFFASLAAVTLFFIWSKTWFCSKNHSYKNRSYKNHSYKNHSWKTRSYKSNFPNKNQTLQQNPLLWWRKYRFHGKILPR